MENQPMPQEGAPQGQPGGEEQNPITQALVGGNEMLSTLATAVEGSEGVFAPEAVEHLMNAVSEYQAFMGMAMGQEGPQAGAMGNTPADIQGRKGAVPADMPMGKGIKPVPA
jgi:hypothetical protein